MFRFVMHHLAAPGQQELQPAARADMTSMHIIGCQQKCCTCDTENTDSAFPGAWQVVVGQVLMYADSGACERVEPA